MRANVTKPIEGVAILTLSIEEAYALLVLIGAASGNFRNVDVDIVGVFTELKGELKSKFSDFEDSYDMYRKQITRPAQIN